MGCFIYYVSVYTSPAFMQLREEEGVTDNISFFCNFRSRIKTSMETERLKHIS